MNCLLPLIITATIFLFACPAQAERYAITLGPAPVSNTPEIRDIFGGKNGRKLKMDRCGQVRELEFIALPGTAFKIVDEFSQANTVIYQVENDRYPTSPGVALYVDGRFMTITDTISEHRPATPDPEAVLSALRKSVGAPYVWGGNVQEGIPKLLDMYYSGAFSLAREKKLILAGLDCSGLLYAATNGYTPRNTSWLANFGDGIYIAGKNAAEVAALLEPLDLIVWQGHVIIVLDKDNVIESRLKCSAQGHGGVIITPLLKRLTKIMKTRRPADYIPKDAKSSNTFVARRWLTGKSQGSEKNATGKNEIPQ